MATFDSSQARAQWHEQVCFRHAVRNDLPKLEWEGMYTHFRRVYADNFARSQDGDTVMWVMELPMGLLIGQVFVALDSNRDEMANGFSRAYLFSIRVKSDYQNAGLGSRMMRHVEQDLRIRGYSFATLNVEKVNTDALRLYERLGYKIQAHEAGRWGYRDHKNRYIRVHEPSWRMEKNLLTFDSAHSP